MTPRVSTPLDGDLPTLREPRYSQSLERGLAIVRCFTPDEPVLGIAEMADKTGMSRSTTHRYVITLVALGFLEQPPSGSRKYRLGSRGSDLGMAALNTLPLRSEGHAFLENLRRKVSYTVSTAVLDDNDVVIVDRLRGFRGYARLKVDIGPGSHLPAYCTSMGKTLLAHLPRDEQEAALKGLSIRRRGPNTITSKAALLRELAQVREAGFAVNNEELVVGLLSIAMPVRRDEIVIGAVDIAAPCSLISRTQLVDECGPHLLEATKLISARLASASINGATPE
jgi:IclR family transcriptional regulator, pca regulon regulatory protein